MTKEISVLDWVPSKGVGENAVRSIIEERKKNGPFKDIYDFVERNDLHQVNRKNFEGLAIAGALDCFEDIYQEPVPRYPGG